jgi:hypothetical protein
MFIDLKKKEQEGSVRHFLEYTRLQAHWSNGVQPPWLFFKSFLCARNCQYLWEWQT